MAGPPHWRSQDYSQTMLAERIALLEYHANEMAENLAGMRKRLDTMAARLWFLDILEELARLLKEKLLSILGRSIEITAYLILAYILSHIPAISAILPSAAP